MRKIRKKKGEKQKKALKILNLILKKRQLLHKNGQLGETGTSPNFIRRGWYLRILIEKELLLKRHQVDY